MNNYITLQALLMSRQWALESYAETRDPAFQRHLIEAELKIAQLVTKNA
jgi:hypothetical protein